MVLLSQEYIMARSDGANVTEVLAFGWNIVTTRYLNKPLDQGFS